LANQTTEVLVSFLQSCFELGLRQYIRREVRALQPKSLIQAVNLAKLMEDKFNNMGTRNFPSWQILVPNIKPHPSAPLLPTPKIPPSNALIIVKSSGIPVKRLSAIEMMEWRENGLCFNCDEKFGMGHKCKAKLFILMLDDEESSDDNQLLQLEGPQKMRIWSMNYHRQLVSMLWLGIIFLAPYDLQGQSQDKKFKFWLLESPFTTSSKSG